MSDQEERRCPICGERCRRIYLGVVSAFDVTCGDPKCVAKRMALPDADFGRHNLPLRADFGRAPPRPGTLVETRSSLA